MKNGMSHCVFIHVRYLSYTRIVYMHVTPLLHTNRGYARHKWPVTPLVRLVFRRPIEFGVVVAQAVLPPSHSHHYHPGKEWATCPQWAVCCHGPVHLLPSQSHENLGIIEELENELAGKWQVGWNGLGVHMNGTYQWQGAAHTMCRSVVLEIHVLATATGIQPA